MNAESPATQRSRAVQPVRFFPTDFFDSDRSHCCNSARNPLESSRNVRQLCPPSCFNSIATIAAAACFSTQKHIPHVLSHRVLINKNFRILRHSPPNPESEGEKPCISLPNIPMPSREGTLIREIIRGRTDVPLSYRTRTKVVLRDLIEKGRGTAADPGRETARFSSNEKTSSAKPKHGRGRHVVSLRREKQKDKENVEPNSDPIPIFTFGSRMCQDHYYAL